MCKILIPIKAIDLVLDGELTLDTDLNDDGVGFFDRFEKGFFASLIKELPGKEADALVGHRDSRGRYRFFLEGLIAEVRFSNVDRYSAKFTPQTRFETDAHTLALFHCDEGTGEQLHDSSGNQHHGQLVQATWDRRTRPQGR